MKKKSFIFNIISIVILLSLIGIYTYRFIHFYRLEHVGTNDEVSKLGPYILDDTSINRMLVKIGDDYWYKGLNPNNYLRYSGLLWRIVKINKNNELVAILNDTNILLSYNNKYADSSINKWLNKTSDINTGIFYKNLINPDNNLVKNTLCLDNIDDYNKSTCNNTNTDYYVGLLSLKDYESAGGKTSYLNNKTNWWLTNANTKDDKWYVTSNGDVKTITELKNYGVRPVITISSNINYISGNGTSAEPYQIGNQEGKTLKSRYISSYVEYSGYVWKVVNQDDIGTKVVLNDYLKVSNKEVLESFSTKQNVYSLSSNTLGYYLNNTFYKTLENSDYIKKGTWYIGSYSLSDKYDYLTVYKTNIQANVGLLGINDMFVNDLINVYTITGSSTSDQTMYTINDKKELYGILPTKELKIRPALYLDSNLFVVDGNGSLDKPYQIGR